MAPRKIELLSPAANKEVAKAAILSGADAVYIGATSHGARHRAANSIEDICEVVDFAHTYRARVYVTVNTLVYDNELEQVRELICRLYEAGVDALIVQDMSILRMDIPPIALHASTQCDTRTPDKARFLESVGCSQIVLARELTIPEIKNICDSVSVPVECFVHGALCVSYSGRCGASQTCLGRSANRGECAQMCRMPYTLRNADGQVIEKDKYLLSLRDFNASTHLEEMLEAGVSSFKIEGRLKDVDYVRNVTAYYRKAIDEIIARNPDRYVRSSFGESVLNYTPRLDKSFNRGFTDYFLGSRRPGRMASLLTPKSMGEEITDISMLHNGDGISFFNARGEYEGVNVNGFRNGRIIGSRPFELPKGAVIHRTNDIEWNKLMSGRTPERKLWVDMTIDEDNLRLTDERGLTATVSLQDVVKDKAQKPMQSERVLGKLGATVYHLRNLKNRLNPDTFIPASVLTELRRKGTDMLDRLNIETYPFDRRRPEDKAALYPASKLDARGNVANVMARKFYQDHGVKEIETAVEKNPRYSEAVMTTRYCMLRELGACQRDCKDPAIRRRFRQPLTITTGPHTFRLAFDCACCEMSLFKE
jgi:putative collagenase